MIKKVTKKIKKLNLHAQGHPASPASLLPASSNAPLSIAKKIWKDADFYFVIPGSDSGKVEEAWDLRICFNFIRGFVPASCTKITFRDHEVFGYFLPAQKVTRRKKN